MPNHEIRSPVHAARTHVDRVVAQAQSALDRNRALRLAMLRGPAGRI